MPTSFTEAPLQAAAVPLLPMALPEKGRGDKRAEGEGVPRAENAEGRPAGWGVHLATKPPSVQGRQ